MKAYLFDAQTGLYEGETFEEADMIAYGEGITPVPPPAPPLTHTGKCS